jgi:signal transduction histidine kinase
MKPRGVVTDKLADILQVLPLPRKTGTLAVEESAYMVQQTDAPARKMPHTLPMYISLLLAMTAIIPLLATILSLEFILRPALIGQVNDALERDAQTKVHLIEVYLIERLNEVQAVSQSTLIRKFIAGDQTAREGAFETLVTTQRRDISHYVSWSLLDPSENIILSYPTAPDAHGPYFILPEASQQLQKSGKVLISDVFYDAINNRESVDLYAHIVDDNFRLLGFVRASLDLRDIWATVDSETQTNGPGSYGVLLDENGVRIAYTNTSPTNGLRPTFLLKAISPLSADVKQRVASENLYGNSDVPLTVLADPKLTYIQSQKQPPATFQINPVEQNQVFAAARYSSTIVPWTYFVMKPLSAVTGLADQQLLSTLLIALLFLVLAIVVGSWTGRRITSPILRSMEQEHRAYVQQQHLNRMKDQILLDVSHELRTPLTQLYGYLELLAEYNGQIDDATQMMFLKRAIGGCEELQILVNDVLETVRTDNQPQKPRLQDVLVNQAVKDVLELFDLRTVQDYELQIAISETLMVRADPQYLGRVLRNLLSNAFKYTPPHTALVIDAALTINTPAEIPSSPSVCISVKDSGPGIPPDDISLLFEKFGRLNRDISSSIRGVGLGLYISKQLVEAMDGHIWVESSGIAGQGSRFCFTLPLVVKPAYEETLHTDTTMGEKP